MDRICLECCIMMSTTIMFPLMIVYDIIMSPITIPCYFLRIRKHERWLNIWKDKLSELEITAVEKHINGPINIYEFRKYAPTPCEMRLGLHITTCPKYLPLVFTLPLTNPCSNNPNKDAFIHSLDNMIKCLNVNDLERNIISRDNRIKRALINDNKECAICQSDDDMLTIDNATMTKCAHVFHNDCLNTALQAKNECPVCREII